MQQYLIFLRGFQIRDLSYLHGYYRKWEMQVSLDNLSFYLNHSLQNQLETGLATDRNQFYIYFVLFLLEPFIYILFCNFSKFAYFSYFPLKGSSIETSNQVSRLTRGDAFCRWRNRKKSPNLSFKNIFCINSISPSLLKSCSQKSKVVHLISVKMHNMHK